MLSAWRWTIFQSPRSRRKIIVTRRTCSCTIGVPGEEHVGAFDGDGVGNPALHILDQVLELSLGAARAERAGRQEVTLVNLVHARFAEPAEAPEDRCRLVLGDDRQPRPRVAVEERRVGRLVASKELLEVAPMASALGGGGHDDGTRRAGVCSITGERRGGRGDTGGEHHDHGDGGSETSDHHGSELVDMAGSDARRTPGEAMEIPPGLPELTCTLARPHRSAWSPTTYGGSWPPTLSP